MFKITFITVLITFLSPVKNDIFEKQLLKDLFDSYYALERPVGETAEAVIVTLCVRLLQIVDVDEKNQILITSLGLDYRWKDENLKWNPSEYGGIKAISVPSAKIWKPDVLLYNNVDQAFDSANPVNAIINYDGEVIWVPPGIFRSSCEMDMTLFPFDDQTCKLKFGSWTHNAWKINLQASRAELDASEFLENGEWLLLLDREVRRDEKFYECCPQPYQTLTFYVHIKRKTLFYAFNIIVPTMVVLVLVVIAFILPPEEGEKMSLSITDLLALSFLFGLVTESVPPTPHTLPILGIFYAICQVLLSMSVMFNVLVLNIYHRNPKTQEMPKTVRLLMLTWVPWVLMMERPKYMFVVGRREKKHIFPSVVKRLTSPKKVNCHAEPFEVFQAPTKPKPNAQSSTKSKEKIIQATFRETMEEKLKIILVQLSFLNKLIGEYDDVNEALSDWFFAARAMDRLCLTIFMIYVLASLYLLVTSAVWT